MSAPTAPSRSLAAPVVPAAPAPIEPPAAPDRRSAGRTIVAKAFLAVAVLLIATSCARHPIPTSYGGDGSGVEKNFIKGCVTPDLGEAGAKAVNSTKVCTCAYAAIKATIPFSEFKSINSKLSKNPGPLPDKMLAILTKCQKDNAG